MDISTGVFAEDSLMAFVSVAKSQLKITDQDSDINFDRLANEAVRHLDCLSIMVKKECELKVSNGMAKIPNGYTKLIGIRVGNNQCGWWGQMIYVDVPFLRSFGVETNYPYLCSTQGMYEIQNGVIMIYSNPGGVDREGVPIPITDIRLSYWSFNVDSKGMMIGHDNYERAVAAYICYKYCLQNPEQYNQYIIEEYKQEWIAQKRFVKSVDSQNQFNNTKRQMASVMNAWISSKTWST